MSFNSPVTMPKMLNLFGRPDISRSLPAALGFFHKLVPKYAGL